jgi:hypothetical protein
MYLPDALVFSRLVPLSRFRASSHGCTCARFIAQCDWLASWSQERPSRDPDIDIENFLRLPSHTLASSISPTTSRRMESLRYIPMYLQPLRFLRHFGAALL